MEISKVIYKVLKAIANSMDAEEFDLDRLSPETLGVSKTYRDKVFAMLLRDGYITGIQCKEYMRGGITATIINPQLTTKGVEYLENNSTMRKIADAAKGAAEIVSNII